MMERIIAGDTAQIERDMILGLARQTVEGDPLALASVAGMRLRYIKPVLPSGFPVESPALDCSAPFLPDAARRSLVKLVNGKDAHAKDALALAASQAVAGSGYVLHPFDYAALETFISATAEERTAQERRFLARLRPEQAENGGPSGEEAVTLATLPNAGKAQKLAFLRALRTVDPAAARDVIAGLWPNEPAAIRSDMIEVLAASLSAEDRDLLERLAENRAASVKQAAGQLLARIPGTPRYAERIAQVKDAVSVAVTGLLRRTKALKLKLTTADPKQDHAALLRAMMGGLPLEGIAAALGETPESLLAAAGKSEEAGMLPLLLLEAAAREGRFDLVEKHQAILDDQSDENEIAFLEHTLPDLPADQQDRLLGIAFRAKSLWTEPTPVALQRLFALLRRALPAELARKLLSGATADEDASAALAGGLMEASAPLVPVSLSPQFIALSASVSWRATAYHQLLQQLQTPPATERPAA